MRLGKRCYRVAASGNIDATPRTPTGKRLRLADGTVTVRGKTGNGEGSVYALGDGSGWKATYYDPAGRLRSVRGRTRAQVLKRRTEAQLAAAEPKMSAFSAGMTVSELARWWLTNVATVRVRPSTAGQYRVLVDRIDLGPLAGMRVAELRVEHVVEWLAALTASGLWPSSVTNTRQCLRQVLDEAVTLEVVATNPVLKARRPKVERTPKRVLSLAEVHRLLAAAAVHPLGAAVGLLFGCGLRVSEALAVAWDDVDLEGGKLTVRRAATYSQAYGLTLGPPKNRGAQGVVTLPLTVVALLRSRRVRQAEDRLAAGDVWESVVHGGRPVDLVFTTGVGGLVSR